MDLEPSPCQASQKEEEEEGASIRFRRRRQRFRVNERVKMSSNDIRVPLLEDQGELGDPRLDFLRNLHAELANRCNRKPDEGINRDDFYQEMIPHTTGNITYYWMAADNPIAVMISSNQCSPDACINSRQFGNVVVFEEQFVETCIDSLVGFCRQHELKVNDEPAP